MNASGPWSADSGRFGDEVIFLRGEVIHGFGRGSKLLGFPTANVSTDGFKDKLNGISCGVYFGWATVGGGDPIEMVMSIGWNPYFQNEERTVEPYLMKKFDDDFYGEEIRLIMLGFIRPEATFSSLEGLKEAIAKDVETAKEALRSHRAVQLREHPFLHGDDDDIVVGKCYDIREIVR